MKKIILNSPMRIPDKKGSITKFPAGTVIEKPDSTQVNFCEQNPKNCVVEEIEKKQAKKAAKEK